MRDLALASVAGTITLLAVYAAGLIFVAQHVADRYSPVLYPRVVRDVGQRWLLLLAGLAIAALTIALVPYSSAANLVDAVVLVAAIAVTLYGLPATFKAAADRARILRMATGLGGQRRPSALRDLVWNSATRGDIPAVELLLAMPDHGSVEHGDLVGWLTRFPELLQHADLSRAVLSNLTSEPLDDEEAERLGPTLVALLIRSLDQGAFAESSDIIMSAVRGVARAPTFTENHECLVFDLGFNVHYLGEEGASSPRRSTPESAVGHVQETFLSRLTPLRRSVLKMADPASLTWFALLLQRLTEAGIGSEFAIGSMVIHGGIYDVLEDGHKAGLLTDRTLEALACAIRGTRRDVGSDDDVELGDQDADELAAHLALYVALLGKEDQLERIMGNAGFRRGRSSLRRLFGGDGIPADIVEAVRKRLGLRHWT